MRQGRRRGAPPPPPQGRCGPKKSPATGDSFLRSGVRCYRHLPDAGRPAASSRYIVDDGLTLLDSPSACRVTNACAHPSYQMETTGEGYEGAR